MDYEKIFDRVMRRIPNHLDKREGSVIWLAVASTVAEITQMNINVEYLKSLFNLDNVHGKDLDIRISQLSGVERIKATHSELSAELVTTDDSIVENGTRFTGGDNYYVVTNHIKDSTYIVKSEIAGSKGNVYKGRIIPIGAVENLKSATITDIISQGYDEETDYSFRNRFYETLRLPATSGNESHYKIWAKEVEGVGGVKVIPTWNGGGTVKLVIIDSDGNEANEELIVKVYNYIETKRPIGAEVTVVSAEFVEMKVTAKVKLAGRYDIDSVYESYTNAVDEYRQDVAFSEDYISRAKLGSMLLSTKGVLDYEDFLLNGSTANVELEFNQVPKFIVELEEI